MFVINIKCSRGLQVPPTPGSMQGCWVYCILQYAAFCKSKCCKIIVETRLSASSLIFFTSYICVYHFLSGILPDLPWRRVMRGQPNGHIGHHWLNQERSARSSLLFIRFVVASSFKNPVWERKCTLCLGIVPPHPIRRSMFVSNF